ncbi:MAG: hypothetical protein ACYDHU_09135 [Acidimicrobiales bacterium]
MHPVLADMLSVSTHLASGVSSDGPSARHLFARGLAAWTTGDMSALDDLSDPETQADAYALAAGAWLAVV